MRVLGLTLGLLLVVSVNAEPIGTMANFYPITDSLFTSGQVTPEHIEAVKAANISLVVNLAPASEERNANEAYALAEQGVSYVNIPVDWSNPTKEELQLFFAVMDGRGDRKTLVHCFLNYRASAFTYLYRVLHEGVDEAEARADLEKVWSDKAFEESPAWRQLIDEQLATRRLP